MDAIERLRKADRANAARGIGERADQPRLTVAQQRVARNEADIYVLPADIADWVPLQDIVFGSPTFGAQFFMPGLHLPDDPNHPIR